MSDESVRAILFSGGAGSRLWPLSRRSRPKQFQPLVGSDSLFQLMVRRLAKVVGLENVFVSTGTVHRAVVLEQVPDLPPENIIAEPEMRDTLAAVGYAVALLNYRHPGSTIATMWGADHIIRREAEFQHALKSALSLAREREWVVKVDVHPTSPSTGLGYIEFGEWCASADGRPAYQFIRQIEKPPLDMARRLVAAGNYLWNTGYMVWTAEKILSLYQQHAPETFQALQGIVASLDKPDSDGLIADLYHGIPKMSIDKGIFEKMDGSGLVVMPSDLGWGDIGAWDVLRDELRDARTGNAVHGRHIALETRNSLVYALPGKTVVTLGIDNLIVVDTGDALLICPADRSQEIKEVVKRLENECPELL